MLPNVYVLTHAQSSSNNLFDRVTVGHGWDLNPEHLHEKTDIKT